MSTNAEPRKYEPLVFCQRGGNAGGAGQAMGTEGGGGKKNVKHKTHAVAIPGTQLAKRRARRGTVDPLEAVYPSRARLALVVD